jgi:trk system potassium uptake protein TrkH
LNAFFQSVTTRTAGFNSIALDQMQPATVFLFLLLMFIGACPGSTGGGVKVTTVFILLLTVHTILRGRSQIEIGGKTIPMPLVFKSTVIVTLSLGLVCSAFFLLLVTQSLPFVDLLFETISAFATVGLSLGITAKLNTFGKLTIIFFNVYWTYWSFNACAFA